MFGTPTNPGNPPAQPKPGEGTQAGGQSPTTYTQDQWNGLKGAHQDQLNKIQASLEAANAKIAELTGQHETASKRVAELEPLSKTVEELTKKIAESESSIKSQSAYNSRLKTLMKYPQLLGDEMLTLIKDTTLEGEALEKVLSPLAERLSKAGSAVPTNLGATPPAPPTSNVTSDGLLQEAIAAARNGDMNTYYSKMAASAQMRDATVGKNIPPVDVKDGIASKPPVG